MSNLLDRNLTLAPVLESKSRSKSKSKSGKVLDNSAEHGFPRSTMNSPKIYFDHEKLIAYQRGIQFVAWSSQLLEKLPANFSVSDQLERASTSVPLNLAEGNAKHTTPDRCRYFDSARGSALECAACLDVLVAKGRCTIEEVQGGKEIIREVVSMVIGLIRRLDPGRLGENATEYRVRTERGLGRD